MQEQSAKQQIVERIKNATNILVTVNSNPSVDELSAALALTLMLNKLDKHATAVFSGAVPPAITFLQPDKTFENTVDSLRDFIIALDKEKADRLRYKVEDDVVRIFITPYRTTITEKDLRFTQGDFNVELIVALGVEKREDLDTAITAHGRILHDATVITINAREEKSELGSIDWQDAASSSLCEMLMSLSEALQSGLLDEQIATALLTGIVAATERFANTHTSSRVMTMAAQLMAAGANQQLIAAKLQDGKVISAGAPPKDGTKQLDEGSSTKLKNQSQQPADEPPADGEIKVEHSQKPEEGQADSQSSSDELEKKLASTAAGGALQAAADLKEDLKRANDELQSDVAAAQTGDVLPPSLGGTLNATTAQAEEATRQQASQGHNQTLLSHEGASRVDDSSPPTIQPPQFNSNSPGASDSENTPPLDPLAAPDAEPSPVAPSAAAETIDKKVDGMSFEATPVLPHDAASEDHRTLADLEAEVRAHAERPGNSIEDAKKEVEQAFNTAPFDPAHQPLQSLGAQSFEVGADHPEPQAQMSPPPLPPMPDFSTLPPPPAFPPAAPPTITPSGSSLSTAPNQPSPPFDPFPPPAPSSDNPPPSNDPGQFKIPGSS